MLNDISDTSKIKVYLKTPGSSAYQYVPFFADNIEIMQFVPAQNAQNKCQINYPAEFMQDGVYYLRVEANDKSNNASGVDWYKQKVQEFETAQRTPQAWMKQILHFGGGSSAIEQRTFSAYLNNYKNIAVRPFMGAKVNTFLKTNSDPIEINMSDSLRNLINNGVAMMTFFGHAGGTGFDISIDDPEEYNNQGKYFLMLGITGYLALHFFMDSIQKVFFAIIHH